MSTKHAVAGIALAAIALSAVPGAPALANGAASTRNILLGGALATYLIVEHNRKVHEQRAAAAAQTAAANSDTNDGWAAYRSERHAYAEQTAVNADLKKEIAYQHGVVKQQRQQLAAIGGRGNSFVRTQRVSQAAPHSAPQRVAMVSYGWGTI